VTTATVDEFDTLRFVKNMTGKGMPEAQAEELAESMKRYRHHLVTREFFEQHLNERLAELETRLTMRIMWASCGTAGIIIAVLGLMIQSLPGGG